MITFDQVRYLDCGFDVAKRRAAQNARAKKTVYNNAAVSIQPDQTNTRVFPLQYKAFSHRLFCTAYNIPFLELFVSYFGPLKIESPWYQVRGRAGSC
jgi:hypothetical protein